MNDVGKEHILDFYCSRGKLNPCPCLVLHKRSTFQSGDISIAPAALEYEIEPDYAGKLVTMFEQPTCQLFKCH